MSIMRLPGRIGLAGPIGLMGLAGLMTLASAQSIGTARILEQAGQTERALSEYRLVLDRTPRDLAAYQGFVRTCRQLARYDSLEAVSSRLSLTAPEEPQYVLGRIDGLLGLKRRKEALELGRALVARWPQQATAAADVLERWQELAEATNYLLAARKSQTHTRTYTERLIALYELQNRYTDATREIVSLVDSETDLLQTYLPRIREYSRKTGSSALLAELGRLRDSWARARAQAEVYLALGREPEALRTARQVMDQDGLYGFAHECEEAGALNAALAVYQEQNLKADQARVLRKLGRNREALALLGQDRNPEALFELAEINRIETKDLKAAASSYERVLAARPGHEPAVFGLASSQLGLGQLEAARRTLGQASRQTDRILMLLAEVLLYRLQFDSVRYFCQELLRRFPESPLVNDGLELALLSSAGERATELARAMYESRTGDTQKALERCETLGKGTDDVAEQAWFLRARLLHDTAGPKRALAILDSFALAFPQSQRRPRQLFEQANMFQALGDENRYRQALEELVVSFPGSPYAPLARSMLALGVKPPEPGTVH